MSLIPNPGGWSEGTRWAVGALGGILLAVGTVLSGAVVQAYNFGVEREHQRGEFVEIHGSLDTAGQAITKLVSSQAEFQKALQQEHEDAGKAATAAAMASSAVATTAAAVNADLQQSKENNIQRIDKLETAVQTILPALARIEQKADDNLRVSNSHTPDLSAVRNAVAPKNDYGHGGQ